MTSSLARILVVDDEPDIRDVIAVTLESEGYSVIGARDAMEAFHVLDTEPPDLVVLDLMLPAIGGVEVLDRIRDRTDIPVLILSALTSEDNRVRSLQLGADDYVTKPFSPRELVARVQALLRRSQRANPARTVSFPGLTLDLAAREVWARGSLVSLTAREFDLLAFLASSPGRVFTRHQLLRDVWKSSSEWQQEGTVTEHIRRLRQKVEEDPDRPKWLQTVRSVGYKFERRITDREMTAAATVTAPESA